MSRDAAAYATQLGQLLPPGRALPRDPSSQMGALLLAFGDEFARLDARCDDLIEEIDPRTTEELLPDWEQMVGLPDPAIPAPVTIDDRRSALIAKLLSRGDPRPAAFIAIAAAYGVGASIRTHVPFAGDVGAGDDPVYEAVDRFWWEMILTVPEGTAEPMVALEHFIRRAAPDHTYVTFVYVDAVPPSFDFDFLE